MLCLPSSFGAKRALSMRVLFMPIDVTTSPISGILRSHMPAPKPAERPQLQSLYLDPRQLRYDEAASGPADAYSVFLFLVVVYAVLVSEDMRLIGPSPTLVGAVGAEGGI